MKKILVIGGACQGKNAWVQEHFPQYGQIDEAHFKDYVKKQKISLDGLHIRKTENVSGICLNNFHVLMRQWLWEEEDYKKYIEFLKQSFSWVVISDEIGNGIVPMEKLERRWREETGRALCELAKTADEVYRIYCGMAAKIKGSDG